MYIVLGMQEVMLALIIIRLMEDSQFIISLTISQFVLSLIGSVTIALQNTDCNLADAYADVALARECIRDSRNEDCWGKVWNRIDQLWEPLSTNLEQLGYTAIVLMLVL